MLKRVFFSVFSVCCVLLLLSGCDETAKDAKWGAVCSISVDNIPSEYSMLKEDLQKSLSFSLYLICRDKGLDKEYVINLSKENGYKSEIYVVPGTYAVERLSADDIGLGIARAVADKKTVTFKRDTRTEIVVSLENPDEMAKIIRESQPSDEILAEEMYSKKIQYMGKVVDLEELWQYILTHQGVDGEKNIYGNERKYVQVDKGMDIILQNTSDMIIPVSEAKLMGIRFYNRNVVLPKGVAIGANLKQIVHSETGLLGTPSYCEGTPFIGMGLADSTLVYVDDVSGDRLSLEVSGDSMLVKSISYEFERYE